MGNEKQSAAELAWRAASDAEDDVRARMEKLLAGEHTHAQYAALVREEMQAQAVTREAWAPVAAERAKATRIANRRLNDFHRDNDR